MAGEYFAATKVSCLKNRFQSPQLFGLVNMSDVFHSVSAQCVNDGRQRTQIVSVARLGLTEKFVRLGITALPYYEMASETA